MGEKRFKLCRWKEETHPHNIISNFKGLDKDSAYKIYGKYIDNKIHELCGDDEYYINLMSFQWGLTNPITGIKHAENPSFNEDVCILHCMFITNKDFENDDTLTSYKISYASKEDIEEAKSIDKKLRDNDFNPFI